MTALFVLFTGCQFITDKADELVQEDKDFDGYTDDDDCNDYEEAINPDATEECNHIDDDCDGVVDTGVDTDGDGYDDCLDCQDDIASIHPGADEICDGVDNDCSGDVDESPIDGKQYCRDGDGDGFGVPAVWEACKDKWPEDAVEASEEVCSDCDDDEETINIDATEICDGLDNNCDGTSDEGVCP